ncbi:hypothetical protein KQI48_12110 [Cellulomonas hominis]|uniref:hypothetical protein n=1 Tax=Cellulomonas hominis TaxID=156981 RepID=UPI001C109761|nr:hypothetical protein [Cellulomonas hominis]MBU5423411.1 hypothetical protein [Cellulomonas hominis]
MTDLDTTIEADPAGLRAVAAWLRSGSGDSIGGAVSALDYARADRGEWSGDAATAFRGRMGGVLATAEDARATVDHAAAGLERFADSVVDLQRRVDNLRSAASAAGLRVTPTSVVCPAPAAPVPDRPGADATSGEVRAFQQATAARAIALDRQSAFEEACAEMAAVLADLLAAEVDLDRVNAAVQTLAVPFLDFVTGAGISGVVGSAEAAMRGTARMLRDQARSALAETTRPGAARFPGLFYDDLDRAAELTTRSQAVVDDAARLARAGKAGGAIVGGVLTGVSIYTDIQAGESVAQATTSNVVGFGASVAAGAGVGMALGTVFPGVGNVVGAVAGAAVGGVVGIFTSGAVDSLFENGWDVGEAFANGARDVWDTGAAIGELGAQGAVAVGDAVQAVGDGLSDAWESIFG